MPTTDLTTVDEPTQRLAAAMRRQCAAVGLTAARAAALSVDERAQLLDASAWMVADDVAWALALEWLSAEPIPTELWGQNPERPEGYLRHLGQRSIRDVFDDLTAALGFHEGEQDGVPGCDEYWSPQLARGTELDWPKGRIIVYAVTGGSEGHYTHVDVCDDEDGRGLSTVILGKTFDGFDAAWAFAGRVAKLLGV
jgi:hypothetical protein